MKQPRGRVGEEHLWRQKQLCGEGHSSSQNEALDLASFYTQSLLIPILTTVSVPCGFYLAGSMIPSIDFGGQREPPPPFFSSEKPGWIQPEANSVLKLTSILHNFRVLVLIIR